MERGAGILMHITSLASEHGIGTLGLDAYEFAKFLQKCGQKYWQMLPLGPTGYGDSPYQSFSSAAGNPYLIDLDTLEAYGLLTREEILLADFGDDPEAVDYEKLYLNRDKLFKKAFERGFYRDRDKILAFERDNADWLYDYALFDAIKAHFGGKSFTQWDRGIRLREPKEMEHFKSKLADEINFCIYKQYLFFEQWDCLKNYVNSLGIKIIGDIPVYAALDSADVWTNPECFQLDRELNPTALAGVPPDAFSADGQLWGNPLYDWEYLKSTGYKWWLDRLRRVSKMFDVIRIDHFRGLESFWSVPVNKSAAEGRWVKGPGIDFINAVKAEFPNTQIIAEDLGFLTPDVHNMLASSGFPGMKVLEFAFDSREESNYLPYKYTHNCVVYTGTHDNSTLAGWMNEADSLDIEFAKAYTGAEHKLHTAIIREAYASVADIAIIPMQDWLELDDSARMNTPSTLGGNWQWRMKKGAITNELAQTIADFAKIYGR